MDSERRAGGNDRHRPQPRKRTSRGARGRSHTRARAEESPTGRRSPATRTAPEQTRTERRATRSSRVSTGTTHRPAHVPGRRAHDSVKPKATGARVLIGVLVVGAVLGVAAFGVYEFLSYRPQQAAVAAGQPVHVIIPAGSSTAEIARTLADLGVIDNALMFRLQTRLDEADSKLKAGEYDLATGMPYELVLERLIAGPAIAAVNVTIPEGFTVKQIAERLSAQAGISFDEVYALLASGAGEFAPEHPYLEGAYKDSLEGYCFPATYTIKEGSTARDVVEMMLDAFDKNVAQVDLAYAQSRGLDLADVVTIASILEREAQLPEEFPLVSSVIYNRLARPMRLQLCATVMYTMPEGTTSLTNADTQVDTPYNTYMRDGLPVGPISNPGLAALQAAAAPDETDYYYYVLTGADGSQTFTRTYDEFLQAKAGSKN